LLDEKFKFTLNIRLNKYKIIGIIIFDIFHIKKSYKQKKLKETQRKIILLKVDDDLKSTLIIVNHC
jgi:hypothetical protein